MTTRAPANAALAAAVVDAVTAALPAFVEAVTAAVLSDPRVTGCPESSVVEGAVSPTDSQTRTDAVQRERARLGSLLAVNSKHRPDQLDTWLDAVSASYVDAADALEWAWSQSCPTSFWQRMRGAPKPAGPSSRTADRGRRGELDQLIAEFRAATVDGRPDLVVGLDNAVDAVKKEIAVHHPTVRVTYTWRRALLDAAAGHGESLDQVVGVIVWCVRTRSHWQRTISQPPSRSTFLKMLGDWRADGQDWSIDDVADAGVADQIRDLGGRWMRYQGQRGGGARPSYQRTGRNLQRVLEGDGVDAVPVDDVAALMRWWFDGGNARFHLRDADFPGPEVVSRALLAMRTTPIRGVGAGVVATNTAASGVHAPADLTELEGLA